MPRNPLIDAFATRLLYPPAKRITERYIRVGDDAKSRIEDSLKSNFYSSDVGQYFMKSEGRKHLALQVEGRLAEDRRRVIPWLDAARKLDGARILEIGCGTGSSTIALAEQGAEVVALDLNRKHLTVAQQRCQEYGVKPDFVVANATHIAEILPEEQFDFIIFFAALEHMTYEELLIAMRNTWNMLSPGGLWVAIETPNRLYFLDEHSSELPFMNWLPPEVAWDYGRYSPRAVFRNLVAKPRDGFGSAIALQRYGRAISFHEFELAMGPLQVIEVVSSLGCYSPALKLLRAIQRRTTLRGRYQALLQEIGPSLHPGFYEPWLNVILRK